jgi:alpha-amylase
MGVMLDSNWRYWNSTTASDQVGWPQPTIAQPFEAYQRIGQACTEFRNAGFSVIRMPPACECAAGIFSDGYDKFNDYSLDNTAFGTAEMLRQCVAMIHANGMQAYGDLVLHQYDGGPNNTYNYPGSNPKIKNGRFPKTPSCFIGAPPGVAADPVPDSSGNFGFGAMSSYLHSTPTNYMHDGAIAAAQWLTATTDYDGYRIDDVKGTYAPVIYDLLHADGLTNLYAFGEYFTGENSELYNWVHGYMQGRAACLDFGFHFNVGDICNNNSRSWMGALSQIGYCSVDAANAITFVESADTDNSEGEQIIWNKILGYAIMMTFPGYPVVYYRDWSDDPGCYGLKPAINNLIWIHEHLANGVFVPRLDTDPQVFVHERLGYNDLPGCLCGFNNDQWNTHTVTVQTSYPPNTRLHEYTGHYGTDIWTDVNGNATFTLPKNDNGNSYLVFARWITADGFGRKPLITSQTFFGAVDLKLPPAMNGATTVGRVLIDKGSHITATLSADITGWANEQSSIQFVILGPDGEPYGGGTLGVAGVPVTINSQADIQGWHTIMLTSILLPTTGSSYEFTISYMAPTSFDDTAVVVAPPMPVTAPPSAPTPAPVTTDLSGVSASGSMP